MSTVDVRNIEGAVVGTAELPESIFGKPVNVPLMHQVVTAQLAHARAGTHKTKTRGEINRTTKKFGRQKGGGVARHGARSAPQFVGGGKAMAPVVRSHEFDLPKKVRALGLRHAVDPDHIAAIDNVVRKLIQDGRQPHDVGDVLRPTDLDAFDVRRQGDGLNNSFSCASGFQKVVMLLWDRIGPNNDLVVWMMPPRQHDCRMIDERPRARPRRHGINEMDHSLLCSSGG